MINHKIKIDFEIQSTFERFDAMYPSARQHTIAVIWQYTIIRIRFWRIVAAQCNVAVLVDVVLFLHVAQCDVAALVVVVHARNRSVIALCCMIVLCYMNIFLFLSCLFGKNNNTKIIKHSGGLKIYIYIVNYVVRLFVFDDASTVQQQ